MPILNIILDLYVKSYYPIQGGLVADIPAFNEHGLLPPGVYEVTLDELATSRLVVGSADEQAWASEWRGHLVANLRVLVDQLWEIGVENIYVDGSFVESKPGPNDIDGYFECDLMRLATGDLQRDLNALDRYKCWTWSPASRRPDSSSTKRQLPMWHFYRVELYPHTPLTSSGIRDEHGNELQFPAAFRRQRETGRQKGIVKLVRGTSDD